MADETPSLADTIANDINRHVLGGARAKDSKTKQTKPLAWLTGQLASAPESDLLKDVVFYYGNSTATVHVDPDQIKEGFAAAQEALVDHPDKYFNLAEDTDLPTWVLAQKQFNLPVPPPLQDQVELKGSDVVVQILPPPVLREAATGNAEPVVSLCNVYKRKQAETKAEYLDLKGIDRDDWRFAQYLRCPIFSPGNKAISDNFPIFELKGIPQASRWFLDRLNLLKEVGREDLPDHSELHLFIEYPKDKGITRVDLESWVIARKNLTGLARPGALTARAQSGSAPQLPYTATSTLQQYSDTMRLIQMASIANSVGYYIRPVPQQSLKARSAIEIPKVLPDGAVLGIILLFPRQLPPGTSTEDTSLIMPAAANAFLIAKAAEPPLPDPDDSTATPTGNRVVRFEGPDHVWIESISPPGTVTFGFQREMSVPQVDMDRTILDADGFAESIHLVDYQITDDTSDSNLRTLVKGDEVPPLTPTKDLSEANVTKPSTHLEILGKRRAVAFLSPTPRPLRPKKKKGARDSYILRYRTTYAYDRKNPYQRLASAEKRHLTISAGFRDLYGNRIFSNAAKAERTLIYTDRLIPPSEWHNFQFWIYALGGELHLKIRYEERDPLAFHLGDLRTGWDLDLSDLNSTLLGYLTRRMGALPVTEEVKNPAVVRSWLVEKLNSLVEGPSLYDEELLDGVELREETEALRAQNPSGRELRILNRLLLEDIFHKELIRRESYDPGKSREQSAKKLRDVLNQLQGADRDVSVSVIDSGADPLAAPGTAPELRANFQLGDVVLKNGKDLTSTLIDSINSVVTALESNQSPTPFEIDGSMTITKRKERTGPLQLYPLLQVFRKKYLPVNEVPKQARLAATITQQVSVAETAMSFSVAVLPKTPIPVQRGGQVFVETPVDFPVIGQEFQDNLGNQYSYRIGMARNRFNEQELWFVPDAAFPKSDDAQSPLYATPRPLKTTLGNSTCTIPYYTTSTDIDNPGFQDPKTHTRVDYDLLGIGIFSQLESLLTPENITSGVQAAGRLYWDYFLETKDKMASDLATPCVGILPMFDEAPFSDFQNKDAAARMARDAFRKNLPAYYDIDTVVGFPLKAGTVTDGISNYFGPKPKPSFLTPSNALPASAPTPTQPTFSDFELSALEDLGQGPYPGGYLTLIYDLPSSEAANPDQQRNWSRWTLSSVAARITHVQRKLPGGQVLHEFDQGQWLELATSKTISDDKSPLFLTWSLNISIPVIERRFPSEPALLGAKPLRFQPPPPPPPPGQPPVPPPPPDQPIDLSAPVDLEVRTTAEMSLCRRFGWELDFYGNFNPHDLFYLDFEYSKEDSISIGAKQKIKLKGAWSPSNLFETLLALEALFADFPVVNSSDKKVLVFRAKSSLALADSFLKFLTNDQSLKSQSTSAQETYALQNQAGTYPFPFNNHVQAVSLDIATGAAGKTYTSRVEVQSDLSGAGSKSNFDSNPLCLFGNNSSFVAFRPRITLKRNQALLLKLGPAGLPVFRETNASLVYRCGPIAWNDYVRVTNKWATVTIKSFANPTLEQAIQDALDGLFGSSVPFEDVMLRVDLQHRFSLFSLSTDPEKIILSTPFHIIPTDFKLKRKDTLGSRIAGAYRDWLLTKGNNPAAVLKSMDDPRLQLRIHVTYATNDPNAPSGRTLLDIESLEFPLKNLTLPPLKKPSKAKGKKARSTKVRKRG